MTSGPAPVYSSDPIAPRPPEPPAIVADAKDLKVLRKAVEDASTVGAGLWVSYLFVLFYLLVAAGSVTHKDLFLETPVKLPFLGVDLPLKGFFVLGPALFLIVHAYVLLHFAMLSGKVAAFDHALRQQIKAPDVSDAAAIRTELRRQLPSNIFVQFLAGPGDVRNGSMGAMLWLIATVSLVIGPVCLLMFFELQFLPYHNEPIANWQRVAVGLDLGLIWLFWRGIALRGDAGAEPAGRRARLMREVPRLFTLAILLGLMVAPSVLVGVIAPCPVWLPWYPAVGAGEGADTQTASENRLMPWMQRVLTWTIMAGLTGGSVVMMGAIATFPGETLETRKNDLGHFRYRTTLERWRVALVAGAVQPASRTPESLWSNRLVLPGLDIVVHLKLDSEDKIKFLPETVSLRDRDLKQAVLIGAVLRKADFTGARMGGALLDRADLRDAKMGCAYWLDGARTSDGNPRQPICTDLQGASLYAAQLQGASLDRAQLQGASLNDAQLQGASLDSAQLQGASLNSAQLQGASLKSVFIWRTDALTADATNAWIEPVPQYRSAFCNNSATNNICDWTKADFDALMAKVTEAVPDERARKTALDRLDPRLNPDTDKPPSNETQMRDWWNKPDTPRPALAAYDAERAKHWQAAGCSADGAPHVVARLTRSLDPATSWIDRMIYALHEPFSDNSPEPAKLAAAFLSDTCEGARGLPDSAKAILVKLRGPVASTPTTSPGGWPWPW